MLTSATEAEFTAFLTTREYDVAGSVGPLLVQSLDYLETLPWCDSEQESTDAIKKAQLYIAYAMSTEGGGFNPAERASALVTKVEDLKGLKEEFMFNESVDLGSSSLSQLKSLSIPYGLLFPYMCSRNEITEGNHRASVFVV